MHDLTTKWILDEVISLRTRYIIELERTADDRVEGVLGHDGLSEPVPFSGWIELLSLLQPPLLAESEPGSGQNAHRRRAG
jgi:hypothetical protein